jgi:O-antigen/teichoic acid export membrane protein
VNEANEANRQFEPSTPAADEPSFVRRLGSIAVPLTVLRAGGQALEFIGWILLARRLGTGTFGQISIVFLVGRYGGLVADWGAIYRGSRDVAAGWHRSVEFLLARRLILSFVLTAAMAAVTIAVGYPRLAPLSLVVFGVGASRDWIALGREQGIRAGIPSAIEGLIIAVGAAATRSPLAAAWVVGVGYAFSTFVSIAINRFERGVHTDTEETHERRTDGWMLLAVLATQVTSTIDIILLGIFKNSSDAGIYAAVYRVPNALLALLSILFAGFLPLATTMRLREPARYGRLIRRSIRLSLFAGLGVLACAVLAPFLVGPIFGHAYLPGQWPLAILLVAMAVIACASPLHAFVQATGHDRSYGLIITVGAVVNLVGNLIFIPVGGMRAAAAVTLATQLLITVLLARAVRRDRAAIEATAAADDTNAD